MDQQTLEQLWKVGKSGALCPWKQALAVAFRKASEEIHDGTPNLPWIASKVSKSGGGHPSREAMRRFSQKVDEDVASVPGQRLQQHMHTRTGQHVRGHMRDTYVRVCWQKAFVN